MRYVTVDVVSDIHLGVHKLLPESECRQFFNYLRLLASASASSSSSLGSFHSLVIAGDLLDNWLFPMNVAPPSFSSLIAEPVCGNSSLEDVLREVTRNGVSVHIVRGNHDQDLAIDDFPMDLQDQITVRDDVNGSNFLIMHGHQFDVFNAPDPVPGFRPLGYYVSRCSASNGHFHESTFQSWVRDVSNKYGLTKFVFSTEAETISFFEKGLFSNCTDKLVKAGCWYPKFCGSEDVPMWKVMQKQSTIMQRAFYGRGYDRQFSMTFSEFLASSSPLLAMFSPRGRDFDEQIRLHRQLDRPLVVFGHTHEVANRLVKKNRRSDEMDATLYANSGTWTIREDDSTTRFFLRIKMRQPDATTSAIESLVSEQVVVCRFEPSREDFCEAESLMMVPNDFVPHAWPDESSSRTLSPPRKHNNRNIPEGWSCPDAWFGGDDGCDCFCGADGQKSVKVDPDCGEESNWPEGKCVPGTPPFSLKLPQASLWPLLIFCCLFAEVLIFFCTDMAAWRGLTLKRTILEYVCWAFFLFVLNVCCGFMGMNLCRPFDTLFHGSWKGLRSWLSFLGAASLSAFFRMTSWSITASTAWGLPCEDCIPWVRVVNAVPPDYRRLRGCVVRLPYCLARVALFPVVVAIALAISVSISVICEIIPGTTSVTSPSERTGWAILCYIVFVVFVMQGTWTTIDTTMSFAPHLLFVLKGSALGTAFLLVVFFFRSPLVSEPEVIMFVIVFLELLFLQIFGPLLFASITSNPPHFLTGSLTNVVTSCFPHCFETAKSQLDDGDICCRLFRARRTIEKFGVVLLAFILFFLLCVFYLPSHQYLAVVVQTLGICSGLLLFATLPMVADEFEGLLQGRRAEGIPDFLTPALAGRWSDSEEDSEERAGEDSSDEEGVGEDSNGNSEEEDTGEDSSDDSEDEELGDAEAEANALSCRRRVLIIVVVLIPTLVVAFLIPSGGLDIPGLQ